MIQESLSRLIKNKTVIIIAHRMRTVADADKIVVLKDGVVAESGTQQPEAQSAWETSGVFHIWQQKTGEDFS